MYHGEFLYIFIPVIAVSKFFIDFDHDFASSQMCFNAFDKAADLDVLDHPILNFIYYLVSLVV